MNVDILVIRHVKWIILKVRDFGKFSNGIFQVDDSKFKRDVQNNHSLGFTEAKKST